MARPSKLTPDLQERICQLIKVGSTNEVAAQAAGISTATFYNWQSTNPEFAEAVKQAQAEAEAVLVTRISKAAASGSWRAACWLLERRSPERWGSVSDRAEAEKQDAVAQTANLYEVSNPGRIRKAN